MTESGDKALLPAGLQDVLAPDAAREADAVSRLIACMSAQGYERVKPPLLEFEETLAAGAGAALIKQTFRLMDPVSRRMMGVRADMTPQIARIAATRLRNAPRPLRLCYGGQVLQIAGSQLRPERQFGQVGAELISAPQLEGDAEVVLLAAEALTTIGVAGLSIDLNLPPLVGYIAKEFDMDDARSADLRQALDRKDAAAVTEIAGAKAEPFLTLLRSAGPANTALEILNRLSLPAMAAQELNRLQKVVTLIRLAMPELTLTIDPVEHRGFEYQTGISFILFAQDVRGELGRGGRYDTNASDESAQGAPASSTGFTLFMDTVLRALPVAPPVRRLFLAVGYNLARARQLRGQGWVTLAGLDAGADPRAEALRLGCSQMLVGSEVKDLKD